MLSDFEGQDLFFRNQQGTSLLQMCVLSGDIKILGAVKALYEADFGTAAFKEQILYAKNNARFSLLQQAIISGNVEILGVVKALYEAEL